MAMSHRAQSRCFYNIAKYIYNHFIVMSHRAQSRSFIFFYYLLSHPKEWIWQKSPHFINVTSSAVEMLCDLCTKYVFIPVGMLCDLRTKYLLSTSCVRDGSGILLRKTTGLFLTHSSYRKRYSGQPGP
jgi:hypothetical protein